MDIDASAALAGATPATLGGAALDGREVIGFAVLGAGTALVLTGLRRRTVVGAILGAGGVTLVQRGLVDTGLIERIAAARRASSSSPAPVDALEVLDTV